MKFITRKIKENSVTCHSKTGFKMPGNIYKDKHKFNKNIFLNKFLIKLQNFSLRRRQFNPLVYTVCVLVHDILFQNLSF